MESNIFACWISENITRGYLTQNLPLHAGTYTQSHILQLQISVAATCLDFKWLCFFFLWKKEKKGTPPLKSGNPLYGLPSSPSAVLLCVDKSLWRKSSLIRQGSFYQRGTRVGFVLQYHFIGLFYSTKAHLSFLHSLPGNLAELSFFFSFFTSLDLGFNHRDVNVKIMKRNTFGKGLDFCLHRRTGL